MVTKAAEKVNKIEFAARFETIGQPYFSLQISFATLRQTVQESAGSFWTVIGEEINVRRASQEVAISFPIELAINALVVLCNERASGKAAPPEECLGSYLAQPSGRTIKKTVQSAPERAVLSLLPDAIAFRFLLEFRKIVNSDLDVGVAGSSLVERWARYCNKSLTSYVPREARTINQRCLSERYIGHINSAAEKEGWASSPRFEVRLNLLTFHYISHSRLSVKQ
ncbi:hypothetical protein C8J56DRAFT_881894 [Mycena floridula]|nr:hypothetical protein C8J56DRAFT_881894 [Mycena floridula]